MKICYLSNTAMPSKVASAIQIVKMCEAFSELGNEVKLITTNVSKSKKNIFKYYNIKKKFKIEKIFFFQKFPLGIWYYLFSIISVRKAIKFKSDIFVTRNYFSCFLLTLLNKKVIMELHHDLIEESRIVRTLFFFHNFLNSKSIVRIIAITNSIKYHYINKYGLEEKKIIVLASGSSIKKNFCFNKNKKKLRIGYFGSVYRSRGFELIIKLARIDKNNDYYIFGDLKKKINFLRNNNSNKNLFWQNYIPYNDVPKYLQKMDILILPYVSAITKAGNVGNITKFTSPLKLFDYLRVGRVILCSNFSVLKEILTNNKNAIFIKNYKNPHSWKLEINKISNSKQKQFIISRNNYILGKKYSLYNRAKKIINTIN